MNLYLDTTNNKKTIIKINNQVYKKAYSSPRQQDIFAFFKQTLKQAGLTYQDITSITVKTGPGSFTSTRVGISLANALSFCLNLKINNQKYPVKPSYHSEPNATLFSK